MLGVFEHIKSEWATMKGAPVAFVIFLGLGFVGGMAWRGQEVANLETLIRIKDGELLELGKQLDQHRRAIDDQIDDINRRLDERQLSIIQDELRRSPSSITVESKGDRLPPATRQVLNSFKKTGWTVNEEVGFEDLGEGDLRIAPSTPQDAQTLQRAFEDSGVTYSRDSAGGFILPAMRSVE